MKKTTLLFTISLFLICNSFAGSGLRIMESMVMHSSILKQDVHFSVCLPKNYYEEKESFPVVYLLHGLGDDETSWLEYGQISQYSDKAVAAGETVPMIFIMPEAFRTYYVNDYTGSFLYQDMFINELVPYIDDYFRTKSDSHHRAVMGYSMGGFGALMLHLKYPDVFGAAVPLSISVRTDEQYITEDAAGWDDQWGRLFGEPGLKDYDRLTDFYIQNSPFHFLYQLTKNDISKLNIYIDNGDKEQTLCRSNEELHILMRNMNIPHQFRVRNGGHSFRYWCSALPNALRFISDVFETKPYRGDIVTEISTSPLPKTQISELSLRNDQIFVYVPSEYDHTNRLYPVIYFTGNINDSQRKSIASIVNQEIENASVCPMLLVFLPGNSPDHLKTMIPELEDKLRIRKGYRFRALAGYQDAAQDVFNDVLYKEQFNTCIFSDAYILKDSITGLISALPPGALKGTSFFIDAPDHGKYFDGNGNIHMLLRDKELQHEYRVREGDGGFEWFLAGLPAIITFTGERFHR